MATEFQKRDAKNRATFRAAAYAKRNPNSYKRITGLAMGEQVCASHGGDVRTAIKPHMGVCYACAVAHGEPKR